MGSVFTQNKKDIGGADIYRLAVLGYIKKNKHDLFIPNDIQYLCLKYYRTTHLIIHKNETRELLCTKYHAPYIFKSITIRRNGTLTVNKWDPSTKVGGSLYITCKGDITLKKGACIELSGKGYSGGSNGKGGESIAGLSTHSRTVNCGGGGGCIQDHTQGEVAAYEEVTLVAYAGVDAFKNCKDVAYAGGGGYGSQGIQFYPGMTGDWIPYLGGGTYGNSKLNTLHLGSGGGSCITLGGMHQYGASGGGALKLTCLGNLKLSKNARIQCNGAVSEGYKSGSGSGGSVHIVVNSWECLEIHKLARIEALGGKKGKYNSNGGDGRIRIQTLSKKSTSQRRRAMLANNRIHPKPFNGYIHIKLQNAGLPAFVNSFPFLQIDIGEHGLFFRYSYTIPIIIQ
eukprot:392150_1